MKRFDDLTEKDKQIFAELLKSDFGRYIRFFFPYIANQPFIMKPFHKIIINKLQNIANMKNKKRNLLINLPVGSGKSVLVELFITWCFARNINTTFCYVSHSDRLIKRLSKESRDIIQSREYQELFKIPLESDDKSKNNFSFVGANIRTGLLGAAMGSAITGADAGGVDSSVYTGSLILDDPIDASNVKYPQAREECITTYTDKLATRRRNPMVNTIVIMQRLHINDLSGWILENEPDEWDIVKIPAIDKNGNSYWSERYPVSEMEKERRINPIKFYSQYQQEPILETGSVINTEWFRTYNSELIGEFERIFITADTAMKTNEWNDYSVFSAWGLLNNNLYLIDGVRGKWEAPQLKVEATKFWNRFQFYSRHTYCFGVYIEDKASGTGLIQELTQNTSIPVIPIQRSKDKLSRIEDILGYIEAGRVFIPENNDFSKLLISECMTFSRDMRSNIHDDIIDTLVDAINKGISSIGLSILDVL